MADATGIPARSPLDGAIGPAGGPADAGIVLRERPHLGKLVLRGDIADAGFADAAGRAIGAAPPAAPNSWVAAGERAVVWLGPDEWLVVVPPDGEEALAAALEEALAGVRHAATVVSDNATVVRLSGPRARAVMAKGCAIDLHPRVFGPGSAAQSRLAKASVAFWQVDDTPAYDILVRASFAAYLWEWLLDAGREYGVRIEAPDPAPGP